MFRNRKQRRKGSIKGGKSSQGGCARGGGAGNGKGRDSALSGVIRGCRCRILKHHAHGAVRQRLLDMGFIPNAEVEVLRVATLGDPMEIKVGDSCVTLRKREADQIEIVNC